MISNDMLYTDYNTTFTNQRCSNLSLIRRVCFLLLVLMIHHPNNNHTNNDNNRFLFAYSLSDIPTDSEDDIPHQNRKHHETYDDHSYLLLCSIDGSIYTLSAWTGMHQSHISTYPLLQTNRADIHDTNSAIIPGLDGRLYYTNHNNQLKELPLTIHSLLENPVRSCDHENPNLDCGILTAEAETSLLALSPTGQLMWKTNSSKNQQQYHHQQQQHETHDDSDKQLQTTTSQPSLLLLQRKDYWVQHVLASTGQQSWNVSLGTYHALDFSGEDDEEEDDWNEDTEDDEGQQEEEDYYDEDNDENMDDILADGNDIDAIIRRKNQRRLDRMEQRRIIRQQNKELRRKKYVLPSIIFTNSGLTLLAVHPDSGEVLWQQNVPSTLSSVFGIHNGQWKSVDVIHTTDIMLNKKRTTQYIDPDFEHENDNQLFLTNSDQYGESDDLYAFLSHDVPGYWAQRSFLDQISKQLTSRRHHQLVTNSDDSHDDPKTTSAYELPELPAPEIKLDDTNDKACNIPLVDGTTTTKSDGWCLWNNNQQYNNDMYYLPPYYLPHVRVQSLPDGLLLSWSIVSTILGMVVLVIIGFRYWYVRTREKWMMNMTLLGAGGDFERSTDGSSTKRSVSVSFENENELEKSSAIRTRSGSIPQPSEPQNSTNRLRRTLSLPGYSTNELESKQHKNDMDLTPMGTATSFSAKIGSQSNHGHINRTPAVVDGRPITKENTERKVNETIPVENSISTIGGIPLIQYSRYASEFKELQPMGKGGFGTVFCCRNVLDGRDYAIKKVSITGAVRSSSDSAKKSSTLTFQHQLHRVLREVKILAVLDHPNIVRYYTAWLEIIKEENDSKGTTLPSPEEKMIVDKKQGKNQSHCYSSSLLLSTDSITPWESHSKGKRDRNNKSPNSKRYDYRSYGRYGNDGDSSSSYDVSMHAKSLYHPLERSSYDSYLIFEGDSKEEDDQSSNHKDEEGEQIPRNQSLVSQERSSHASSSAYESKVSETTGDASVTEADNDPFLETSAVQETAPRKEERKTNIIESKTSPPSEEVNDNKDDLKLGFEQDTVVGHTLYIQMELCSQKTVADFLLDPSYRCHGRPQGHSSTTTGANKTIIDIPKALRLFQQIAEAVKHVHSQGLIHRDLKPSNCFLNEPPGGTTTVKVGDFGLSRHGQSPSGSDETILDVMDDNFSERSDRGGALSLDDHTAGVGTRLYASPEQMNGSDYDCSTDVYSLGIMLFELLYPMYTRMERNICLSRLRDSLKFPNDWQSAVGTVFPDLEDMILRMVRREPSCRPSAESIAKHVSCILGEFTVLALDQNHSHDPEIFLLRIEAQHREDTLGHTIRLIRDITSSSGDHGVTIVQYGLRSSTSGTSSLSSTTNNTQSVAIMEFALKYDDRNETKSGLTQESHIDSFSKLIGALLENPGIFKVRQISSSVVK